MNSMEMSFLMVVDMASGGDTSSPSRPRSFNRRRM